MLMQNVTLDCHVLNDDHNERLRRRRQHHHDRRQRLVELGILSDRKAGRPRMRSPEEAQFVAQAQRRECYRKQALMIRLRLAELDQASLLA